MIQDIDLINCSELGRRLDVKRNTIVRWRKKGLPYYKTPGLYGRMRFNWAEVVSWLKSNSSSNGTINEQK